MLGNWNYRRCKKTQVDEYIGGETIVYFIAEVYYNKAGAIVGWEEEPNILKGETQEEQLKEDFDKIAKAFDEPLLDLDKIEIVPVEFENEEESSDPFYDYKSN
jgi:hypothetical protein